MNDHIQTDQTLFAAQEPYLDSSQGRSQLANGQGTAPDPKKKMILLAIGGVAVVLVVIIVMGMMFSQTAGPMVQGGASPTPKARATGKYADEINQLTDDLQQADPTQRELPFPPVNPEITF